MVILALYVFAVAVAGYIGWHCAAWKKNAATSVAGVFCSALVAGVVLGEKCSWLPEWAVCDTTALLENSWYAIPATGLMVLGIRQSRLSALREGRGTISNNRMVVLITLIVSALLAVGGYGLYSTLYGPERCLLALHAIHPAEINGVVLQNTPYTCGPCACATLLRLQGVNLNASELGMVPLCHTLENKGSSSLSMAAALKQSIFGTPFRVRLFQPAFNDLGKMPLPAIVSVNCGVGIGHVVVLCALEKGRARIADPSDREGLCWWTTDEFKRRYLGDVVTLER